MSKITFPRWTNVIILIMVIIGSILAFCKDLNLLSLEGTASAIDAYINFSSITIGFLATLISMLFVLAKQDFLKNLLAKREAKVDFVVLGCISIVTGFVSLILSVITTFLIANGNNCGPISLIIGILLIDFIIFYLVNVILFLIVNLISVFIDV